MPLVVSLLKNGSPAAIIRRVVSVVVDAVDGLVGGSLPHISQKVLKGIQPSLADLDTATPVMLVPGVIGVVATGLHALPSSVFGSPRLAVFGDSLEPKATAAFSSSVTKLDARNDSSVSAVAKTLPPGVASLGGNSFSDNKELADPLAEHTDLSRRDSDGDGVGIAVSVPASVVRSAPPTRKSGLLTLVDRAFVHISQSTTSNYAIVSV